MTIANPANGLLTPPPTPKPLDKTPPTPPKSLLCNISFLFNHDSPQIADLKQEFAIKSSQKLAEIEEEHTSNKYQWQKAENDRNWNGERMYLSRWDGKKRDYPYTHPINDPLFGVLHTRNFKSWVDELSEISMSLDYKDECDWNHLCWLRHCGGLDGGMRCLGYIDGVVEKEKMERILEIFGDMEKCLDGILEEEIRIGDRLMGGVRDEKRWKWKNHYRMVWDVLTSPPDEDKICNGCEGACCVAAVLKP